MSQGEYQFTAKEKMKLNDLQEKMNSNSSSMLEKQIAQAEMEDLMRSKEPAPKNHRHHIDNPDAASAGHNSNILHDDEAFEKFDMGVDTSHHPGSKNANQATSDRQSIKFNHKARGSVKEKGEEFDNPIVLPEH